MGEKAPATTNRSQYHLNRRVTFSYATSIEIEDSSPDDVALENARQQVLDQVGPPYAAEGHLPRAAAGLNAELPEWRWGSLPNNFQTEMANWIKHYINQYAGDALAGGSMDPMTVDDFEVRPRPIAQALVAEILADPISFLEGALGRSAG